MKLREARDAYYEASGTLSTLVRQLGFAGVGIVFAFTLGRGQPDVPPRLTDASIFIALALIADLLQYVWRTAAWGLFQRSEERRIQGERGDSKGVDGDVEVDPSPWLNTVAVWLLILKTGLILVAYWHLLGFLWDFAR